MLQKHIVSYLILLLFACYVQSSAQTIGDDAVSSYKRLYHTQGFGIELPENYNCALYDTVENWIGTPYRYSGNSSQGIDCSGFVNTLYSKVYFKNIGRNSGDIYKAIRKVDKEDLKEGDLVFFRIRKQRISHVGLYLGGGKFVHASTSNGVILSDLSDKYYRRYYAGGGPLKVDAVTESGER